MSPVGHNSLVVMNPENLDAALAARVIGHFLDKRPFPDGEAGMRLAGHTSSAPTSYGVAWQHVPGEFWIVHRLASALSEQNQRGGFDRIGAAGLLVTNLGLRLLLTSGGPGMTRGLRVAPIGDPTPSGRLEQFVCPWNLVEEARADDLLVLRLRTLGRLVLRLAFPRTTAALIAGLCAQVQARGSLGPGVPKEQIGFGPTD